MQQWLYSYVYQKIKDRVFLTDKDISLYITTNAAMAVIAAVNLILLVFYTVFGVLPLGLLHLFFLAASISSIVFIQKNLHTTARTLLSVIVVLSTVLDIIFVGGGNYIILYFFLVLLMQMATLCGSPKVRGIIIGLLWLGVMFCIFADKYFMPLYPLSATANLVFSVFNINMAFVVGFVELVITNTSHRVIDYIHEKRVTELEGQAYTDQLTGLYNRHYIERFLDEIRRDINNQKWCVAMLDIDDFKRINDGYGHAVGDIVLQNLADTLKRSLRRTDIVFRWGGEEFLLLLNDVDIDTAVLILEKLRSNIQENVINADSRSFSITATIGVAKLDINDVTDSINSCDRKMYTGKTKGKNIVIS